MKYLIVFLVLSLGCARSVKVGDSVAVESAANPVVMIQYRMPQAKKFSPSIYFRDSNGKEFRVTVPKDADPETGVVFELPVEGSVRVVKFSHPDANLPIDVERYFPSFFPEKGRINHIGFLSFKLEKDALYVSPIKREDSVEMLKRAEAKHGFNPADVVNAYTGKEIPLLVDNGVLQYQKVTSGQAKIEFEDKVWKCQTEETKKNLIILGSLRFLVNVDAGKISEVKVLKSNHSASQDFEACADKLLRQAEVSQASFKADIPIIF